MKKIKNGKNKKLRVQKGCEGIDYAAQNISSLFQLHRNISALLQLVLLY